MDASDDIPGSDNPATRIQNAPDELGRGVVLVGRYEVQRVLGEGGMGVVVSALDQTTGRRVALKFLQASAAHDLEVRERFQREARAASSITCDHVVRVFDAGTLESGSPFIVMELLEGQDLGQVLDARGPLGVEEAVDHVLEALVALGLAHLRGIVHRDLKPANLFLTQRADGRPIIKVLDFGLSKDAIARQDLALTKTSQSAMGTPLYMAPEQIRSFKSASFPADLWAMGVILFELVSKQVPFDGESIGGLFASIAADPPLRLDQVLPSAPKALTDAVHLCLAKDPTRRPRDVPSLAAMLVPLAGVRGREAFARLRQEYTAASGGWDVADARSVDEPPGRGPRASWGTDSATGGAPTTLLTPSASPAGAAASRRGGLWVAAGVLVLGAGATLTWLLTHTPTPSGASPTTAASPPPAEPSSAPSAAEAPVVAPAGSAGEPLEVPPEVAGATPSGAPAASGEAAPGQPSPAEKPDRGLRNPAGTARPPSPPPAVPPAPSTSSKSLEDVLKKGRR